MVVETRLFKWSILFLVVLFFLFFCSIRTLGLLSSPAGQHLELLKGLWQLSESVCRVCNLLSASVVLHVARVLCKADTCLSKRLNNSLKKKSNQVLLWWITLRTLNNLFASSTPNILRVLARNALHEAKHPIQTLSPLSSMCNDVCVCFFLAQAPNEHHVDRSINQS